MPQTATIEELPRDHGDIAGEGARGTFLKLVYFQHETDPPEAVPPGFHAALKDILEPFKEKINDVSELKTHIIALQQQSAKVMFTSFVFYHCRG